MLKHHCWKIVITKLLFFLMAPSIACAIDPFTIAAVTNAAASAISNLSDTAGEVSASTDAFSELYGEIDSESDINNDGQKLIQKIREIETLANEVGYTKDDLAQLSSDSTDPSTAQKLSTVLRSITKAVRAGKRAGKLIMKLDQKAKISEVESAQINREQLIINQKQLILQYERDLRELKEKLLELKNKRDQIKTLRQEEVQSGAKEFGKTGVLSFPKQESVVEEALKVAIELRRPLLTMVLLIFLIRVVAYQFGMFFVPRFGDLIRDTILCTLLLAVFPEIVHMSINLCNNLSQSVGMGQLNDVQPGHIEFPSSISMLTKTLIFFEWLFDWIKYYVFICAQFLTNFGLAFLIVVFPIVIFCSQMLNFSVAWHIFLAGFIALSLWPLFWNSIGMLAGLLWHKNDASFKDQCATVLFSILQFCSPFVGMATLKGQPIAKVVSGAAQALTAKATGGSSLLWNTTKAGYHGMLGNSEALAGVKHPLGKIAGRVLSYIPNQLASRSVSAAQRFSQVNGPSDSSDSKGIKGAAIEGLRGFVSNQINPPHGKTNHLTHVGRALKGLKRTEIFGRMRESVQRNNLTFPNLHKEVLGLRRGVI